MRAASSANPVSTVYIYKIMYENYTKVVMRLNLQQVPILENF